jgi:hypothetical protein
MIAIHFICFVLNIMLTRVVTVPIVGGVVDVDVVLERPGSQMLKTQNVGSNENKIYREIFNRIIILPVIGADSGAQKTLPDAAPLENRI